MEKWKIGNILKSSRINQRRGVRGMKLQKVEAKYGNMITKTF